MKGLLLALFAVSLFGCITQTDQPTEISKIDTVLVEKIDTVLIEKTDTLRDTIYSILSPFDTGTLLGVWHANYSATFMSDPKPSAFQITLAITNGDVLHPFNFNATRKISGRGDASFNGGIDSLSNGLVKVDWSGGYLLEGPGNCSWALSLKNDSMWLQEIGNGFFSTSSAIRFTR